MSVVDPSLSTEEHGTAVLSVRRLGGIDSTNIRFDPGVTLLTGRNATNRTSLLSALGGVLGGTTATLKSDADEGAVSLTLDDTEYTRTYTRASPGGDMSTTGTPFTDDATLVDLFVALLTDNPARQAVARGEGLRDLLMRPVDTAAVEARIADLEAERRELESELDRITQRRDRVPALRTRRESVTEDIEALEAEIEALRDEVAAFEASLETAEEAAAVIEELDERRQDHNDVTDRIEVAESELTALREERATLEEELADLPVAADADLELSTIGDDLQRAREQRRATEETVDSLTEIVEFNADLVESGPDLSGVDPDSGSITAALAPADDQTAVCWTCGSTVDRGAIEDRLTDLRAVIDEKRTTRADLDDEIAELQERRDDLEARRDERDRLRRQLEQTEAKIDDRETDLERLRDTAVAIRDDIERLETRAAETEQVREHDLLDRYERLSDLQYERGQLEQQRDDIAAELREIETLPDRETLVQQRDGIQADLESERARVETLERRAVEAFNERMADLLDILAYDNIARVWIERRVTGEGGSSGRGSEAAFELHVVRESASGTVYEDEVATLSESERELIGLVVALAGYLVHEVYEDIPFILVDSVETIDATRIAGLVDYFAEFTSYLLVALLPEDANTLPEDYEQLAIDSGSAD